jgi:hypothetical protein
MDAEALVSDAERTLEDRSWQLPTQALDSLVRQLISVYDGLWHPDALRRRAASIVERLATRHELVIDRLLENARAYGEQQHVDDAFPYSPNSFGLLGSVGAGNERIRTFLLATVHDGWGIQRWEAVRALCVIGDAESDRLVSEIVVGLHPPRQLDFENDVRIVETLKGKDFVRQALASARTP